MKKLLKPRKKLGLAFVDQMVKINKSSGHFKKANMNAGWEESFLPNINSEKILENVSSAKLLCLACLFLITIFTLFLRIFHLQVVEGVYNRELADYNRVQVRVIHAPRGVIYDRNNKVLADNNPGFRLKEKLITRDEALKLEAQGSPNLDNLEIDAIRNYPLGPSAAHLVGYVGQITEKELKTDEYKNYRIGDRIGRSGLEQLYEHFLKGTDGAEIIEIDSSGNKLRTIRRVEPVPGNNLYLSIDNDLQQVAFNSLKASVNQNKSCCGAVVVQNPNSGEIIALVSYPAFDGNAFTDPSRNHEVASYFSDPNSPLLNRAISGTYPPGSTFKITSALAALSSGKFTPADTVEDTGVISLGPYTFANWYFTEYGKKDGLVDLVKAIQRSNDIYFYKVGERVGEEFLGTVAAKLGFGKKLGIDLPGEASGLIPNNKWKIDNYGQQWYPGDSLHMAIGQGFILVTPLQIDSQLSVIASNGRLYQPHLVTKITRPDGSILKTFSPEPVSENQFKKEELAVVKQGLALVPKSGGTAWPFFNFSIPTAGKTGTAEFGDPKNRTHGWYSAYAPVESPQITATALVEAGGEGSSVAAPVVKSIFTWYFNSDKVHPTSLDVAPVATASAKLQGE